MNKEKVKAESREAEKEIDRYERIVERAHSEVQAVRSVYKWFAGLIGIISAVGIGAATFLTYNTLTDMRTDFRGIKSDIQKELAAVQVKLVDRIGIQNRENTEPY